MTYHLKKETSESEKRHSWAVPGTAGAGPDKVPELSFLLSPRPQAYETQQDYFQLS